MPPINTSLTASFSSLMAKPVGRRGLPALIAQVNLSQRTRGRGAYCSADGIIYFAQYSAGNLLRFDTVARTELSPLAVTGATDLRGVTYNVSNDRLYSVNNPSGTPAILKIDRTNGSNSSIAPSAQVGTDLQYISVSPAVWFTGAGNVTRLTNADAQTLSGLWSGSPRGLDYASVNTKVVCAGGNQDARMAATNPADVQTGFIGGIDHWTISYGPVSRKTLVGNGTTDAAGVRIFDPVTLGFSTIPVAVAGRFQSGAYSSKFGLHVMIENSGALDVGVIYFMSDAPLGRVVMTHNIGRTNPDEVNDSLPIDNGVNLYVVAPQSKILYIFG